MVPAPPFPAFLPHLEFDLAEQRGQHHIKIAGPSDRCFMITVRAARRSAEAATPSAAAIANRAETPDAGLPNWTRGGFA